MRFVLKEDIERFRFLKQVGFNWPKNKRDANLKTYRRLRNFMTIPMASIFIRMWRYVIIGLKLKYRIGHGLILYAIFQCHCSCSLFFHCYFCFHSILHDNLKLDNRFFGLFQELPLYYWCIIWIKVFKNR